MSELAVGTIVAKSCLSLARVLAASFREHHPDVPFFVLLADQPEGCLTTEDEPFELLKLEDLEIPDLPRFCFNYHQQELSYAATPYLLTYLLARGYRPGRLPQTREPGAGRYDRHPRLAKAARDRAHAPSDGTAGRPGAGRARADHPSGRRLQRGFLGVSSTPTARNFLDWWQDRVYRHCCHDVPHGLHFEQRWLDLVPAYFADVHFVRDQGFNVGHWNLPERRVRLGPDGAQVDGHPLSFLRFSGFEPERPHFVTRYSPRLTMDNIGEDALAFRDRAERLGCQEYDIPGDFLCRG